MARSSDLEFPPDLFYHILLHVKDLTFLWTDCREVSRDFARAVERVFITKHFSKTWVGVDCGWWFSQEHHQVSHFTDFEFDRIDPSDPSRVVFADRKCAAESLPGLISRLRSHLEYGNPCHDPQFTVQIRREINDTAIPGLEVDIDKLELSFEWRGLYSAFFREEREHLRRSMEWSELKKTNLKVRQAQTDRGEVGEMEAPGDMLKMFGSSLDDTWKTLRRERICREVLEKEGVEWTWHEDEDAKALRKLKEARTELS